MNEVNDTVKAIWIRCPACKQMYDANCDEGHECEEWLDHKAFKGDRKAIRNKIHKEKKSG